jgi:hypothetical protein
MSVDAELNIDLMRAQLRWLESEMASMRRRIEQMQPSVPVEDFAALEGIWQGIVVSESEISDSRFRVSKEI